MTERDKCEDCKRKIEAESAKLLTSARSDVDNVTGQLAEFGKRAPGRNRRFEQVKVIERDFFKLSDEDFKLAREDMLKVMKRYRGD